MKLSIPAALQRKMNRYSSIDWRTVAHQAIFRKIQALEQTSTLLNKSSLLPDEALSIGRAIKKRVAKKHD